MFCYVWWQTVQLNFMVAWAPDKGHDDCVVHPSGNGRLRPRNGTRMISTTAVSHIAS